MAKFDSSNTEQVKSIIYNGDLYQVYHLHGVVTSITVKYDNMSLNATPVEWTDLPPAVQQTIDDEINL